VGLAKSWVRDRVTKTQNKSRACTYSDWKLSAWNAGIEHASCQPPPPSPSCLAITPTHTFRGTTKLRGSIVLPAILNALAISF
jgi:hypothetical protein